MEAPWEERLATTFVQLADTLVSGFDLPGFLRLLARRSRELLDVSAVELMVAGSRGELHLITDTGSDTGSDTGLDIGSGPAQFQASHQGLADGPGPECLRTGRVVTVADLAAAQRWPRFAEAAVAVGYRSAQALPMRLREDVIGAATLLRDIPGAVEGSRLRVWQSLVDVATIGILQHRAIQHNRRLAGQLHTALTSRVPIEQAKGVLSERLGVGVDQAFAVLRGHARQHNRGLAEIAREVVDGRDCLAGAPGSAPVGASAGGVRPARRPDATGRR
ncbi:MAG TPA: GAF and ANTAR domain-containing protein [Mycobacteriales bacterium]|nr:GAF and ANTAR domain-containing protein [Mycobacteriales bacterium]